MDESDLHMHYVCTHEAARELVRAHNQFWVSNCGCREDRGHCARSRMDVCLIFTESDPGSGSGKKEITLKEVEEIFLEAQGKHLVTRPFRNQAKTDTEGICFCCDDCCGYFLDPNEKCDKGTLVEETTLDECSHCGACTEVCYFNARKMNIEKLEINHNNCYGCGLCVDVCPESCIEMVPRH